MHTIASVLQQAKVRNIIDEYTASDKKKIPGIIYCAFRNDAEPIFEHYSGTVGISSAKPMSSDTIFWLASFTKLVTSVSCMQLVERGILRLDDPGQVESICSELRDIKVLTRSSETGEFELVEKTKKITLRMLLNHTAGFGYAFEDEKLAEFGRPVGLDDFCGERSDFINRPLVNQPGEVFQYGTSMDWVGVIIERVSGLSLEEYFQTHVFEPLGMKSVSFFLSEKAKQNLAYMHRRSSNGELVHTDHVYRKPLLANTSSDKNAQFCAGGHGCFGKPAEFRRLIALLLNDGVDAKTGVHILESETVEEMLKDQIPYKPRFSNECVPVAKPWLANPTPLWPMPEDHTEGWGLSFSISHFPTESGRAAGSASWEGLANLYWFADRTNNVGGIIASQILPYGDRLVLECSDRVEAEIYRALRGQQ